MTDEQKKPTLEEAQTVIIDQAFKDLARLAEIFHGRDLFSILGTIFFFGMVTIIEQVEGTSEIFKNVVNQTPYQA